MPTHTLSILHTNNKSHASHRAGYINWNTNGNLYLFQVGRGDCQCALAAGRL